MSRYSFLIFLILFPLLGQAQDAENENSIEPLKYTVQKGDTIYNIAQKFDLGVDEILLANPEIINSKSKFIYSGKTIILPTTHLIPDVNREGIVINLAELRIYFFVDGKESVSFPISIGKDEATPLGKTKIVSKRENPSWTPPASIREEDPSLPKIVPPGPNNPLGDYALNLDASHDYKWHGIMIHGTNAPRSIGSRVSHGCIRLYPRDIERLFNEVEIETPVEFVNQPIKVEEISGKIYIEVHLREAPDLVLENLGVNKLICKKVASCEIRVDWQKVDDAVVQNLGVPVMVNNIGCGAQ
jgi:L,D-transpeptidase ErfK/SrfK